MMSGLMRFETVPQHGAASRKDRDDRRRGSVAPTAKAGFVDRRNAGQRRALRARVAGREALSDPGGAERLDRGAEDLRVRAAFLLRARPRVVDDVGAELGARIRAVGIGRRQEELEALDVARRRPGADLHVPAADPPGARRDSDLVLSPVVPHRDAGDRSAVALVVAGLGRVRAAGVQGIRLMDRVVPVVGVRCRGAVPAAVLRAERRMIPLHAGVGDADDDALSRVAESTRGRELPRERRWARSPPRPAGPGPATPRERGRPVGSERRRGHRAREREPSPFSRRPPPRACSRGSGSGPSRHSRASLAATGACDSSARARSVSKTKRRRSVRSGILEAPDRSACSRKRTRNEARSPAARSRKIAGIDRRGRSGREPGRSEHDENSCHLFMVREEGFEPSRAFAHGILSPARLPVPPLSP